MSFGLLPLLRITSRASSHQKLLLHSARYKSMTSQEGPVQVTIKTKITEHFQPEHLEILNESYMHSVPKGSESHFKVIIVSDKFDGQTLIKRHRMVNGVLKEELEKYIHALTITAKTPAQWAESSKVSPSPKCMGGAGL